MIAWMLLAAPAAAEVPWTGITRTQGGAEVRLTLAPAADDTVAVTLFWPEYDEVTLEGTLSLQPGCAASTFDAVRARIDGACRSADTRLDDRHPIYDYVEKNRVRCVLGEGTAPGWCRLQYTGWFEITRGPGGSDVTEAARAELLARAADAPDEVALPAGGDVRWFRAVVWDALDLVPTGEGPLEGPAPGAHALYLDEGGQPVLHRVDDRVADRITYDEQGRARMRETFTPDELDSVRWLHVDRGTPAVLAWGSRRSVYLLRALR